MSQLGSSALGSIVGEGMGLLFSGVNNDIQANQQQRLTDIQTKANEDLSAFNFNQQLQLWNETNYPAQVQQLEKAGLNPALLYHGAGAGGTTGSPSGGAGMGIAQGTSPTQIAQLALQSQEAQADINLKNAQANNLNAQTPQEAGLMQAQIASITQGVSNQQAQQALTQAQTITQNLNNQVQGQTIDDSIASIRAAATQVQQTAQQAVRNNWMDQQTMNDKLQTIHGIMLGQYIDNALKQAQTKNIGSDAALKQEQITQITNKIAQDWQQIGINQQNANTQEGQLKLQQLLRDVPDSKGIIFNGALKLLQSLTFAL